jgi:transcriptional regulator with XRE-family HTH domain
MKTNASVSDSLSGVTNFSRNLKTLRESAGFTQAQLEEKAGLSGGQVARYETTERRPKPATVRALARALGCAETDFDREPNCRVTTFETGYTHLPTAIALLESIPKYAPIIPALKVYKAKSADPTVREWREIAQELLVERTAAEGEGIGDEAAGLSAEKLEQLKNKGRRKR